MSNIVSPYSLKEAACALGVSETTITRFIAAGELEAFKAGRQYKIPRESVETYKAQHTIRPYRPVPVKRTKNTGYMWKPGDKVVGKGATPD